MAKLYFRIGAEFDKVIKLREEIAKLKNELKNMDSTQSPDTFKKLNAQLGESTKKMNILISNAAKAGATMENDFKKGIYDGEKAVNSLSEEIIKQKNIIRETQNDVSVLTEQYKKLGKYDPKRQSLSDELNRAKAALGEQKYALGELQSQQALARLSTKALKDEYALFKDESKAVITVNEGVGVSFKKTLAAIGGIAMLKQVASNVVSTAGMFQKYESVLTNALNGSSDKAKAYLSDINSFAAKTNFQLDELTDDFIKFVNRGVTPSMDAMKKMGDFTNTVAKPFDQLTEAILDINNPERWKEFGIRVQTEGNKVKLSFRDMTVECDRTVESVMKAVGQFGSMKGVEGSTEAIAKTIEGQMSNLEDTITTALAEIGLANQGLISGSISAVDTIVKNYDIIGKSVLALIEIYGVYRAGLLINTIVEQGSVKSIWAKITATKAATVAQAAYNKVLAMNPYVAVGMAVVSLGVAVYTLAEHTTYAEKTARSAAESMEKMKNASENLKNKINELLSVIRDETSTQYKKADAYLNLQNILPEVFKNMDIEKIKLMDKLSLLEKINKASDMREIVGAKTNVVLAQKEVDKINALIAADSQRGTYSGQYEIQLSDAKSKLEAAKKVVADIEKIQIEANKQKEKDDKKIVVKNKEHWTNQKKEAETALNSIASSQKKLMDAGNFKGIDAAVVKSYKDNVKKLNEAEKELKVYDTSSKQESATEALRKKQEKYTLLIDKQKLSQIRAEEDAANEIEQIEIDRLQEGSEKVLRQRALNHRKELEAIEREAEDNRRKVIEEGRVEFESNPENKKKSFNAEDFIKTEPAKKKFAIIENVAKENKITSETKYNRGDDLTGLLNEYQDYTDKRISIERKFNEDIATLQEQRKQAVKNGDTEQVEQIDRSIAQATKNKGMELMGLDYDKLKESPEYVRAFENLKETSSETLNSLLTQLENAKQTAAQVLSPDQLREYTSTIQSIMDELDSRNPFQSLSDKKKELAEAEEELANAQIELENAKQTAEAVKGGAKIENGVKSSKFNEKTGKIESTKAYLSEAQALDQVKKKTENYNAAKDKVVKKDNQVKKSEKEVRAQISELADTIDELGKSIGGPAGEIISLIGNIGAFTMTAMSGVEAAADTSANAISTVEKASVILAIISAAMQVAMKIFDMFGKDDTTEKYEKAKEVYESYISILDKVIEKQLELAETLTGDNANAAYNKALETIKLQSENAKVLGKQYLNSGASRKSHSKGYDEVDDMSWEGWKQAANTLGMTVDEFKKKMGGRMTGLFDLTDEQLASLQENAGIFWSQLDSDTQKYADQIANGVEKVAEVMEQRITDTTLIDIDGLRSDFQDLLTDMDADSADFADNFEEYMRNAILNSMLKDEYMDRLTAWREKLYNAMDDGVTEDEYNALKAEGQQIADEMKAKRDAMSEMYNWGKDDDEREASKKGIATASQDSVDENNGRLAVMQEHTYSINENVNRMATGIDTIVSHTINLSCLASIDKTMQSLLTMRNEAVGHLSNIDNYTSNLVEMKQYMNSMKQDINTMLIKGLKLSK